MIPPSETGVFFGKKVPWLNKLVESLLLQQSISKQTADVELSRLHFGQGEVIVDVKGMISKRFPKPYACHLKMKLLFSGLNPPKKNGKNRPWEKKQKDKRLGKRFCFNPGKAFFQPQGFFSLKDCLDWTKRVTFTLGPARPASNIVNMRSAWC